MRAGNALTSELSYSFCRSLQQQTPSIEKHYNTKLVILQTKSRQKSRNFRRRITKAQATSYRTDPPHTRHLSRLLWRQGFGCAYYATLRGAICCATVAPCSAARAASRPGPSCTENISQRMPRVFPSDTLISCRLAMRSGVWHRSCNISL